MDYYIDKKKRTFTYIRDGVKKEIKFVAFSILPNGIKIYTQRESVHYSAYKGTFYINGKLKKMALNSH